MSFKTRNLVNCPLFDAPKEMSCVMLPTYECIIKEFLWTRIGLEVKSVNRNLLVSKPSKIIAKRAEDIWKNASIPIVSHQRIVELVKQSYDKYRNLLKPYKQTQNVASYKLKDGFIRNTLDSRARMPKFETNKDFSH
ncbi:unnamed protein product [Psylliodes chrysocephalus]|uniref:Uncharacterized protein n=1 Tax=Psylliodes chrysocephalus TaxID=3402493 RepID=A0A9P0GFS2_9CUCU|nr:unnamed protein product [Psylliodes chrysocephala]